MDRPILLLDEPASALDRVSRSDVLSEILRAKDEKRLALPKDEGVFHGVQEQDGLPCAHPVQVWLDLKGHPERAGEAARHLEETLLTWRSRA
jgi:hypothetical protein